MTERTRQSKKKVNWSDIEKQAWKPPERLTVSEWADKYRVLDSKTSNEAGPWRTERTPYLQEIMDQYNEPDVEEIVFCKASQIGGTEALMNVLGYIIDQDPSPTIIVYPIDDLAEWTSENRIQPMLEKSPALSSKFMKNKSSKCELQFPGMYTALIGSNSPADLATRPCRYVIFDETDKFPVFAGREAGPIQLAKERTKTYKNNRKILYCSTPTLVTGAIWQELLDCDVIRDYHVPCPYCGHEQTLKLKGIKWPKDSTAKTAKDTAWYECEKCSGVINDNHKLNMLKSGKWKNRQSHKGTVRKVGFHINSIYSPWLSFGDVAAEFIKSKPFPEKLMNFINSWLGEPWKDEVLENSASRLQKQQHRWPRGVVPDGTQLITAGVDIQLNHFWYEIKAWGPYVTGKLIEYGRVENWFELEEILINQKFCNEDGEVFIVNLAAIDSGFRTDEVYEFCSRFPEVCRPVKGSSKRLTAPYSVTNIDKDGYGGLKLWIVDGHFFKDMLFGRMRKDPTEPGSWSIFKDCPEEYVEQLTAEQKVTIRDKRTGQITEEWQKVTSGAANHLLDCAVYSAAAAEMCRVRYLQPMAEKEDVEEVESPKNNWFNGSGSWFGQ